MIEQRKPAMRPDTEWLERAIEVWSTNEELQLFEWEIKGLAAHILQKWQEKPDSEGKGGLPVSERRRDGTVIYSNRRSRPSGVGGE